jgi:hypothetical protein
MMENWNDEIMSEQLERNTIEGRQKPPIPNIPLFQHSIIPFSSEVKR